MRLRDARVEDLTRLGAVFGRTADDLMDTAATCRRSALVSWRGRPSQQYQRRLTELTSRLDRISSAYDEASAEVLVYARSMGPVVDLALQADLLEAQADDLASQRAMTAALQPSASTAAPAGSWTDLVLGGGVTGTLPEMPADERDLRERARYLRAEAEQQESLAAGRLALALHALADDAPAVSRWTRASHSALVFSRAAAAPVTGTVALGGVLVEALPMVGTPAERAAARKEAWAAAKAAGQPWLAVEDLLDKLSEHEWAQAAGVAVPGLVLRSRGLPGKRTALFGTHDDLPHPVLRALQLGGGADGAARLAEVDLWVAEHAQRQFLMEAERLKALPVPTLADLRRDGVNLVQQEALGGHTILKHVGRDLDFLRRRQLAEARPGKKPAHFSSFLDRQEAEDLITAALRDPSNRSELEAFASGERKNLRISSPAEGHGLLIDEHGQPLVARFVIVDLIRDNKGEINVQTSFLDDVGAARPS
jgi:hypothetical protein